MTRLLQSITLFALIFLRSCAPSYAAEVKTQPIKLIASWERFSDSGKLTKYGARFDPNALTCATFRYTNGTMLKVTDMKNGLSVIVRVIDTPAKRYANRVDLSPAAFKRLNGLALGIADVTVDKL